MKQIVCEACGGKDLVKHGLILICQHCDTKYYIGEDKKSSNDNEILDSVASVLKAVNSEPPKNSSLDDFFEKKIEEGNFDWEVLAFLSFFLGWLGIDRFYVGSFFSGFFKLVLFLFLLVLYLEAYSEWDFLKIITLLVLALWWFADFYCIAKGEFAGFRKESEQDEQDIVIRIQHNKKKDNWL